MGRDEGCARMAGLTGNTYMRAVQHKPRAEVIECSLRMGGQLD